jgi:hypothetical protein
MKIDRQDITRFVKNIKHEYPEATDKEFAEHLCKYMEMNPGCIDPKGVPTSGRYSYHTVGYGVFSLMGERYRMGRVEVFDRQDESGYQIHEGFYCMPFESANQFESFIESIQTDLPIHFQIGDMGWCERECARDLGFTGPAEMKDQEKVKEYRRKKNDEYAVSKGYKDWDDFMANSKFGLKKNVE